MFPMSGCSLSRQDSSKPWAPGPGGGGGGGSGVPRGFGGSGGAGGEVDEETKKNQNIINIVRDGQISLLVRGRNYEQWRRRRRWAMSRLPRTSDVLPTSFPPPLFLYPPPPFPDPSSFYFSLTCFFLLLLVVLLLFLPSSSSLSPSLPVPTASPGSR